MKGCALLFILLLGTPSQSFARNGDGDGDGPAVSMDALAQHFRVLRYFQPPGTYQVRRATPENPTSSLGTTPTPFGTSSHATSSPSTISSPSSHSTWPSHTTTTSTPIPTSPSSTPSSCGFEPECPPRGTTMIANPCPKSCQKYFECKEGSWSAKACLPWENFDHDRLSCDWWWNVDCSWLRTTTPSIDFTTFPVPTTPVPITRRPPCTKRPPTCPSTGAITIADPCHCQKFYNCTQGQVQHLECLPWENFDPKKLECVFMLDVDCNWLYHDPTTDLPTKPTTWTPTPTATTTPAPAPTPTTAPPTTTHPDGCDFKPTCPTVGTELFPIPCEGYCSQYYECKDGKSELKTCPKTAWVLQKKFHPEKKECFTYGVNCDWYKDPKYLH